MGNIHVGPISTGRGRKFGENSLKIHQKRKAKPEIFSTFRLILSYFTVFSVAICPQGLKA
jgi:hypothetical protein